MQDSQPQCFNMSPKELVHDSARYNKRLSLARQTLKASRHFKPPQPFCSTSSQTSDLLPRASDLVPEEHEVPSATATQPWISRRPRKSRPVFDHVLPTPMAELNHNYRMVLSQLQPVGLTATRDKSPREARCPTNKSETPCLVDSSVWKPGYAPALSSLLCCLARHADLFPGSDILGLYCQVAHHFNRPSAKELCDSVASLTRCG